MMYPYYLDTSWLIFVLPAILLATYAQGKISSEYNKYSKIDSNTGLTGAQVANIILSKNGMTNVKVEPVGGRLTDHYDPRSKVIRLSRDIYYGSSVASLSIAAHEVGHAIQHHEGYSPLEIRTAIAPIVGFSSRLVWIFILIGFATVPFFINLGIALFLGAVLFQIITLPVEFNASKRALVQLEDGIMPYNKLPGSKEVLKAAALTYVAATLVAVGEFLRLLSITRRRND